MPRGSHCRALLRHARSAEPLRGLPHKAGGLFRQLLAVSGKLGTRSVVSPQGVKDVMAKRSRHYAGNRQQARAA